MVSKMLMKLITSMKQNMALIITISAALIFPFGFLYAAPAGFEIQTVLTGLNVPTDIVYTSDGSHIYIAEKAGVVRVAHSDVLLPTPAITLPDVNTYNDRGLLSIVLDPNFDTNGYLYLLYTYENTPDLNNTGPKTAQLLRVTLDETHVAIPGSETVILGSVVGDIDNPSCTDFPTTTDCIASDGSSHSIADLAFGPDGKLYVSVGDASSFAEVDPWAHRALDLDSLNGKVLRINSDGTGIADNPYYNGDISANRSKVWNLGLRNPFRIGFRPANGSLYIGDVGWYTAEEVNIGVAGANFGWPCQEGVGQTPGYDCVEPDASSPLYVYPHDANGAGSVIGGVFYTGATYPEGYNDTYFFGDFSQDWIKRLVVDDNDTLISVEDFMLDAGGPVAFNTDVNGNIVYLSIYTGELRRIVYTIGNLTPVVLLSADQTAGLAPLLVQFSSAGTFDPDGDALSYAWEFGNGDTSTQENPRYRYRNDGVFTATLTVTDTFGASASKEIVITVGNQSPQASIVSPGDGSFYEPDQFIQLSGEGQDLEDGTLLGLSLNWRIILHHNIHIHILEEFNGLTTGFFAPDHGTVDDSLYIEIELTATDSAELTGASSVGILPAPALGVDPHHVISSVLPMPTITGEPFTITSTIINNGTGEEPVLVDMELYDENGVKVGDSVYESEILPIGVETDYTLVHTVTTPGIYRLALGLIYPGWQGLHEWTSEALLFTVGNGSTNTAPSITLLGDNPVDLMLGDIFTDPGATAQDAEDGDISSSITVGGGSVDTNTIGTYTIAYDVVDSGGLAALQVTRDVVVSDAAPALPFIVHIGSVSTPVNPNIGEEVTTEVTVRNDGGAGAMVIGLMIFDGGNAVHSVSYDNEPFAAGEEKTLTITYTPTHAGAYGIDMGIWGENWSYFQDWLSHVGEFTATDVVPPASIVMYDDSLVNGWASWSWDTTADFASTVEVSSGAASAQVDYQSAWGGLFLHNDGADTTGFTNLTFDIHGGAVGGQELQILSLDASTQLVTGVLLANYLPSVGTTWSSVSIPLSDLGITDSITTGFIIQGISGSIAPTFYLDSMFIE